MVEATTTPWYLYCLFGLVAWLLVGLLCLPAISGFFQVATRYDDEALEEMAKEKDESTSI